MWAVEVPNPVLYCPYGKSNDTLWVRESHFVHYPNGDVWYRADNNPQHDLDLEAIMEKWQSPLFMKRSDCRLTLTIEEVRVQRVQEISREDIRAEGCPIIAPSISDEHGALTWYRNLWDKINAERGFGWNANPWVWALTFSVKEIKGK